MSLYTQLAVAVALLSMTNAHLRQRDERRSSKHIVIDGGTSPSKLSLRLCNAFTDSVPVAVVLKSSGKNAADLNLTNQELLQYKSCRDWHTVSIRRGDSLEFEHRGAQLGAFAVTTVPQWDAAMLLLIVRRKGASSRPLFTSHVFSKTTNAQVAVLDMYNGPSEDRVVIEQTKPMLTKESAPDKPARQLSVLAERLAYDSVVAVTDGSYVCALTGNDQKIKHASRVPFKVVPGVSYVAMRVGTSDKRGFPEELIVFPSSESYRVSSLSSCMIAAALLSLLPN